jgi:hypothetical protein
MAASTTTSSPDPKFAGQIWDVMQISPDDNRFKATIPYTDSDGNSSGQMIANPNYDPNLTEARDYLLNNGYITSGGGGGGGSEGNTENRYHVGPNAPHNFASYDLSGDTAALGQRLVPVNGSNRDRLINPDFTEKTPWGTLTMMGNVKAPKYGWQDALWQYAPLILTTAANALSGGALTPMQSAVLAGMKAIPTVVGLIEGPGGTGEAGGSEYDLAWTGPGSSAATGTPAGSKPGATTSGPPGTSGAAPSTTPAGAAQPNRALEVMNLLEGKPVTMTGAGGRPGDKLQNLSRMFNLLD